MASFPAAELHPLSSSPSPLRTPKASPFLTEIAPKTLSFPSPSRRAPHANLVWTRNGSSSVLVSAGNRHLMGSVMNAKGLRFAVVVARFNEIVTNPLLEGALQTFRQYSVKEEDITVVKVPGSFEIPVVAQKLGKSGAYHAILCIGAVVRGDTTHYDAVANSAASGVLNAGLSSGVPCIFGVLTCDDMEQLFKRRGVGPPRVPESAKDVEDLIFVAGFKSLRRKIWK